MTRPVLSEPERWFVALDVGCYECGEPTNVLGVFTSEAAAQAACDEHEPRQENAWQGQHSFEVHEIPAVLDQVVRVEYV